MSKLLQIDSSGMGKSSVTRPLTAYFADKWKAANPEGETVYRDLISSQIPIATPEFTSAIFTPADQLSDSQRATLSVSDEFLAELMSADTYVFGVPMYNFSVPGVFKLYIDQIVRAGKTFSFANGAPQGLLKNKRLVIITASGADYSVPPMDKFNFVEPYLRAIFGFMGVQNVEVVSVSGRDPQIIAQQSDLAKKKLDAILSTAVPR